MLLSNYDPNDPFSQVEDPGTSGPVGTPPPAGPTGPVWNNNPNNPNTTPITDPSVGWTGANGQGGNGGRGGGGVGGGGLYTGPPGFHFPALPAFHAPVFNAPTLTDAMNEPGYQFRLQSGEDALQNSAAAKGILRTGGTLKDLINYGQNFASQEYNNVYNRALQGFQANYQGKHDEYAPLLAEWQTKSQAEIQAELAAYDRQWQLYALQNQYHAPVFNIPPAPTYFPPYGA